jgi:hypothetical protein
MSEYKLKFTSASLDSEIDSSIVERMIDSFSPHQKLPRIATNQRKKDRKKD